jgi:hypothetical protein
MSIESRIEYLEKCDNCIAPPGTRCESAPGGCLYQIKNKPKQYSEDKNKFKNSENSDTN